MIKMGVKKFFLDLFFPKFCVGCRKEGVWLCAGCAAKVVSVKSPVCPGCGRLSQQGRYCGQCQKGHTLRGVICAAYFEEGPLKEIIHHFKYNSVISFVSFLGDLLAPALAADLPEGDLTVTFVPLHAKRFAQRGYNQSELLARHIAEKLNLPVADLLIKKKKTKMQVELQGDQRRRNLRDVFVSKNKKILKGKTIILVDDVTTTGATLDECAKVLKAAGAKEVWGLVVARG